MCTSASHLSLACQKLHCTAPPGFPLAVLQMPGFSLALSEVVSDLWQPDPADVR